MSLPSKTTVLIVGAGPTGLTTALSLAHRGFHDFIIVDAIPKWKNASRAVVIHAATLEALDTIGCGDDIIAQGNKSTAFNIGTRSTKLLTPDFKSLKPHTRHAYMLIIPQNVSERTLENKLASFGIRVHRPFRAVGLRPNAHDPNASDVTFEDGSVITAKYVIGADGARSVVRATAGISFSDPMANKAEEGNNVVQVVLADVTFDTVNADESALSGTLSPNSFFILFPLPSSFNKALADEGEAHIGERIYRIGSGVPIEEGEIPQSPSKEYLQELIDRFGPYFLASNPSVNRDRNATRIKDVIWSSRFRNHAAIADTTFTRLGSDASRAGGVVLLIGDAAHVHSPIGGQGMNLGLRDAVFLGEALTKHFRAAEMEPLVEADSILREFADARHARALEVIGLSKGLMSVVGMKHRRWFSWWCPVNSDTVRSWVLWMLGKLPFFKKRMAWQLSGLGRR